jgi:hypothetical protein
MMKEVEPFAAIRKRVCRLSSRVATKRKVATGHQPGNGERIDQAATPDIQDMVTIAPTKR